MGQGTTTPSTARRHRIIERPRLTRALDNSDARIKMLVAPAGYGKTTLARQWLAGKNAVWYTATRASCDVAALAGGIRGSIAVMSPGTGDVLMERLAVTARPDEESHLLASLLAADLRAWPRDGWLVVDDYHELAGTASSETFVESLFLEAPLNVLLLTRRRPSWASSRRLLYGEVFELDRAALAMTGEEARELLGHDQRDLSDVLSVAQGWPAMLGLAAMTSVPPPDISAIPHLYRFFAEEVYRVLDRRARRVLCELALYELDGRSLALASLSAQDAERAVGAGVASGFLTQLSDGRLEMHPLLRTFLERKLMQENPKAATRMMMRAVRRLIEHELWDEAFVLAKRLSDSQPLIDIVSTSMVRLLALGRTSTLRQWVMEAPQQSSPIRLAAAELAFREGRFYEAESFAVLAATGEDMSPEMATRAHIAAGRAAHAASREEQAGTYYAQAAIVAGTRDLRRVAAFGELSAAIELEAPHAIDLFNSLGPVESLDPDERVVLVTRMISLQTRFALPVSAGEGRAMLQMLHAVADPIARASFMNVFSYTLAAMGNYREAVKLVEHQLEDAEAYRLPFIIPYALTIQALAKSGLHEYQMAEELLDEADERAIQSGDETAYHIAWAVRARMYNAQGAFDLTLSRPLPTSSGQTKSIDGELTACFAVALAGSGETKRAREHAERALTMSRAVEIAISAPAALGIAAIHENDYTRGLSYAERSLNAASRSRMLECFISAYRGCPELVMCLLQNAANHEGLKRILQVGGDTSVAAAAISSARRNSVLALSSREKEVLSLLSQGMTNIEIGTALYISPATVKVHVRHIFEKLGVRSRASAALRGSQLSRGSSDAGDR